MADEQTDPPGDDPLIDEVRAIRREISARFDNDVEALCRHLQELEKQYADRIVQAPPQPETTRAG